jgi:hypothetical protein
MHAYMKYACLHALCMMTCSVHDSKVCSQNKLDYFTSAESYWCKMFIKLTTDQSWHKNPNHWRRSFCFWTVDDAKKFYKGLYLLAKFAAKPRTKMPVAATGAVLAFISLGDVTHKLNKSSCVTSPKVPKESAATVTASGIFVQEFAANFAKRYTAQHWSLVFLHRCFLPGPPWFQRSCTDCSAPCRLCRWSTFAAEQMTPGVINLFLFVSYMELATHHWTKCHR